MPPRRNTASMRPTISLREVRSEGLLSNQAPQRHGYWSSCWYLRQFGQVPSSAGRKKISISTNVVKRRKNEVTFLTLSLVQFSRRGPCVFVCVEWLVMHWFQLQTELICLTIPSRLWFSPVGGATFPTRLSSSTQLLYAWIQHSEEPALSKTLFGFLAAWRLSTTVFWTNCLVSDPRHGCVAYWPGLRDHLKAQESSAGVLSQLAN